ncbi:MFS transporter [Chondromyces crocatus]|uniref:MFS transporter n=1 Tax=Chondromyces crocatus TaxID=52 RepID=A0A0K1EAX2_CHOCO|nr:MFS transporter [Chondromyces crocatus]AKT38031.1 MFS transporter [Chondromyces crocatus]
MTREAPTLPVRLLAAVALSAALAPLNSTMIAVALPEMAQALPADSAALRQGLVTSYLLTNIVLQSPGGKLGDRLGHRRALALGQFTFALGAAVAYLMPTLSVLTTARITMAAGGAVLGPSAMALLRTELPPAMRPRAFGAFGALMGLSAALGPKIGGLLVAHFGWTSIFLANVPVLLLSALLAHTKGSPAPAAQAQSPAAPPRPFDVVGSVLLGLSLIGIVLGLENAHLRWAAALGLLGFIPFALWERRVADPVIDFSLFRQRAFVGGSLLIALQNLGMYSVMFELPQVAGRLFTLGKQDVGNTLVAMMVAMVIASPLAGRLSERFGERAVATSGSLIAVSGMVLLLVRPLATLTDAVPALALLGAGLGLSSAPSQAAAMSDVPREKSGMAAGVTTTMRYIGGVGGVSVLGLVLSESRAPELVHGEHATAMMVFCVALLLATGCARLLPGRAGSQVPAAKSATS